MEGDMRQYLGAQRGTNRDNQYIYLLLFNI